MAKKLNILDKLRPAIDCILFLDIETVPLHRDMAGLPLRHQQQWARISTQKWSELNPVDTYEMQGGLWAEFGKVVCISVGTLRDGKLIIKSFAGHDEARLLNEFAEMLNSRFNDCDRFFLCAHNGFGFDYPFLVRRLMMHGIEAPVLLSIVGNKTWDNHWLIDTMDLWRLGDYRHNMSLDLLATVFDIPSPKSDIAGAEVAKAYYDNQLRRIVEYCQRDVVTLVRVLQRMLSLPQLDDNDVVIRELELEG